MRKCLAIRYIGYLLFFFSQEIIAVIDGRLRHDKNDTEMLIQTTHRKGQSQKGSFIELKENDRRKAIVGGDVSSIGRYPYMVTVQYHDYSDGHQHGCGGSLIAQDIILTAAHCSAQYLPKVIIGDHDLSRNDDGGEHFDTTKLIIHPEYFRGDKNHLHDIMLLKLSGNSTKTPVTINKQTNVPDHLQTLVAIGWGSTDIFGLEIPDILKESTLEYVDASSCSRPEGILCAQDLDGIVDEDTCQGDSGGPLIIKGDDYQQDIQVGLTSAGPSPCAQPLPAYYTRLSYYLDWIKQIVCSSSSSAPDDFDCKNDLSPHPSTSAIPTSQPSITNQPSVHKIPFTIAIRFDRFPEDISWELNAAGSNHDPLFVSTKPYSPSLKYNFVYETIRLQPDQEYTFSIYDINFNGICCSVGTGYYFLYWGEEQEHFDETKVMFWKLGTFQQMEKHSFVTSPSNMSKVPKSITPIYAEFITIEILFDDFPFEISWNITSKDSIILYSHKPQFSYVVSANQKISEVVYLPAHQILKFELMDSMGDGLLKSGYVRVYEGNITENIVLFEKSGKFLHRTFFFSLKAPIQPSLFPISRPSMSDNSPNFSTISDPVVSSPSPQIASTPQNNPLYELSLSNTNDCSFTNQLLRLVIAPSIFWVLSTFSY